MPTTNVSKGESTVSLSSDNHDTHNLEIRHLESQPQFNVTTVTILVVDRKISLAIEKVDDLKESFIEAVGLSTYSTSQPTVTSYLSIFENFWNQTILVERLKDLNRRSRSQRDLAFSCNPTHRIGRKGGE